MVAVTWRQVGTWNEMLNAEKSGNSHKVNREEVHNTCMDSFLSKY